MSRRAAAKPVKYRGASSSEAEGFSSDDEPLLFDNEAVKEKNKTEKMAVISSDSETESPPKQSNMSSEDMFDSLIG